MSTRIGSKVGLIQSIEKDLKSIFSLQFIVCIGCTFGLLSCFWIFFGGLGISLWQVFSVAALFGIGGTAMLIGSLSLTADLIGDNTVTNFQIHITFDILF